LSKLILDTSICIDLHNGKLLKAVLRLPHKFVLPDVIIAELLDPAGGALLQLGFIEEGTSGEETQNISALRNQYTLASLNDLFALLLAKINNCYLITGDNALRNAAKSEGVATHGLFWLIDEMVKRDILTGTQATDALKRIIAAGSWLPKKECEDRIKKWRE
jgi:predicted nucleic acid-binding protein